MTLPSITGSQPKRVGFDPSIQGSGPVRSSGPSHASTASAKKFAETKQTHKQHDAGKKVSWFQRNVMSRLPGGSKAAPKHWTPTQHSSGERRGVRQRFNDEALVTGSRKELGSHGAFNRPERAEFRTAEIGVHRGDTIGKTTNILKIDKAQQIVKGLDVPIQRGVGVSGADPRMVERNIATSIVNDHLQTTSVPKASAGRLGEDKLVVMSVAPGIVAKRVYAFAPGIVKDPEFQHQMSDIEVNAFLSASPDGHNENYMIDQKKDPKTGAFINIKATMIDNDMSFGSRMTNPDRPPEFFEKEPRTRDIVFRHTGLPAYMDAKTCARVKDMDVAKLSKELSSQLKPEELDAFKSRCTLLKNHVTFLETNNRVVGDWKAFTNPSGKPLAGGSFIKGTLEMSGVQQGNKPGAAVIAPRSMILRDIIQSDATTRRGFDKFLTQDEKRALDAWGHVEAKIVPPSGLSHKEHIKPVVSQSRLSTDAMETSSIDDDAQVPTTGNETGGEEEVTLDTSVTPQGSGYTVTPFTKRSEEGGPLRSSGADVLRSDARDYLFEEDENNATTSASGGSGRTQSPDLDVLRSGADDYLFKAEDEKNDTTASEGSSQTRSPDLDVLRSAADDYLFKTEDEKNATTLASGANSQTQSPDLDVLRSAADDYLFKSEDEKDATTSASGGNGQTRSPDLDVLRSAADDYRVRAEEKDVGTSSETPFDIDALRSGYIRV